MWSAVVAGSRQDESTSNCTGPFSTLDRKDKTNTIYVLVIRISL